MGCCGVFIRIPAQFNFISETIETRDLAMAHSIVQICFVIPNSLGGLVVALFADMVSVRQMYMYSGIAFCLIALLESFFQPQETFTLSNKSNRKRAD